MEQEQSIQNLHHSKWLIPVIIGGLALLVLAGAAYAAIQYSTNSKTSKVVQVTETPKPSVTPTASETTMVTATPTPTPHYTITDSTGINTFTGLGVSFQFDDFDKITNLKTAASVSGNIVTIGDEGDISNSGISLTIFDKATQDDLKTAITKQVLNGQTTSDCTITIGQRSGTPASFQSATITYPTDQTSCPTQYANYGGDKYFLMDTSHPDKLLFINRGQFQNFSVFTNITIQ